MIILVIFKLHELSFSCFFVVQLLSTWIQMYFSIQRYIIFVFEKTVT